MKNVTIEFSEEQLSVINAALMEIPYRLAAPVINHINLEIKKSIARSIDISEEISLKNSKAGL